jgi:hypothetical protein
VEAKSKAELQWAKRVATDFLEAACAGKPVAVGLLSPALAKAMGQELQAIYAPLSGMRATITSRKVAPNRCEVIFAGALKENEELRNAKWHFQGRFKLRVAKEIGGTWNIRFVDVTVREVENQHRQK